LLTYYSNSLKLWSYSLPKDVVLRFEILICSFGSYNSISFFLSDLISFDFLPRTGIRSFIRWIMSFFRHSCSSSS